jgi:hypothetical protein
LKSTIFTPSDTNVPVTPDYERPVGTPKTRKLYYSTWIWFHFTRYVLLAWQYIIAPCKFYEDVKVMRVVFVQSIDWLKQFLCTLWTSIHSWPKHFVQRQKFCSSISYKTVVWNSKVLSAWQIVKYQSAGLKCVCSFQLGVVSRVFDSWKANWNLNLARCN